MAPSVQAPLSSLGAVSLRKAAPRSSPRKVPLSKRAFREYIRFKNNQTKLSDLPNTQKDLPVHLILSFATDYKKGKSQNGDFKENWDGKLEMESILELKRENPNIKLLLSIGWFDETFPFNVTDNIAWITRAITSIRKIINCYNLDGLDVNYCKINPNSEEAFTSCLGKVICILKDGGVTDIVSISPIPGLDDYYSKFYSQYSNYIDWVDYKFYAGRELHNVEEFLKAIDEVQEKYDGAKLVMGYSTDRKDEGKLVEEVFFKTYGQRKEQIQGISVWCADESPSGFPFEQKSQTVLVS